MLHVRVLYVHWPSSHKKTNCRYCHSSTYCMVIMRTWPLHTVHCTPSTCTLLCGARSVLGHVASLMAVAVPHARDRVHVHVREAYYIERRDTKQNSKQKLFYFISKSSKLILFYCHFKCRKVKGRNFKSHKEIRLFYINIM